MLEETATKFIARLLTEKSYLINPKSVCINHFPIDLETNGRPFGSKSIRKW